MDALSDVLRAVRLTGAVFFDVHASEPWVAETPPGRAIVGQIFPGAEHLIPYHVIVSGTCWGHIVGNAPRQLVAGDVIVFRTAIRTCCRARRSCVGRRASSCIARGAMAACHSPSRWGTRVPSGRASCAGFSAATHGRSTRCSRLCRMCSW